LEHFKNEKFLTGINKEYLFQYFKGKISLFRYYQNLYLKKYGCHFSGTVIEIGGINTINNRQFFPNAKKYILSNISGDVDMILDVTNMNNIADNSIDSIICVSVLEHVFEIKQAMAEIERVLKPGGELLITTPYIFPYHDNVDYYRFSKDYYLNCFTSINFINITKLGGVFSSIANTLQRPCGKLTLRYCIYKTIGFFIALLGIFLDTNDNSPLGYAVYGKKNKY